MQTTKCISGPNLTQTRLGEKLPVSREWMLRLRKKKPHLIDIGYCTLHHEIHTSDIPQPTRKFLHSTTNSKRYARATVLHYTAPRADPGNHC